MRPCLSVYHIYHLSSLCLHLSSPVYPSTYPSIFLFVCLSSHLFLPVILYPGWFCTQGTLGAMFLFLIIMTREALRASGGWGPGVLVSTLQYTAPNTRCAEAETPRETDR